MKGVGSYNDWAYYALPSSNLSAFAAPFSVNRSIPTDASAPFADSSQTLVDDAVQSQSRAYDFFHNPNRDSVKPYAPQLPHFNGNSMGSDAFYDPSSSSVKPSVVIAQPYYPLSPPIRDPPAAPSVAGPTRYWSPSASLGGSSSVGDYANKSPDVVFGAPKGSLWNPVPEVGYGKSKQVGVESSATSKQTDFAGSVGDERAKQACHDLNGEFLLLPHQMFGREKNSVSISADQLEDKPCWWETVKPMPVEFSDAPFTGTPIVPLETYVHANSVADSGSGNLHLPYSGSYDKHLRQHYEPSGADAVSSTPMKGLVMDLNIGNTITDGDPGNNNFYTIEEAYHMPRLGTASCFDVSHLRMHLESDGHSSSNTAMISDKNVSRDIVNDIFKERHGSQNPHLNLDNLSLRLSAIEDVNSVEKSFEGADRCNPAVDSPCWKGAPAAHFSRREASVALPPQYVPKKEECIGSAIQEPQKFSLDNNNNVKYSCENSNSYNYQETSLAGSSMKCSVTKDASDDYNSDGAMNAGSFQSELSYDCGLQYLDGTTESKSKNMLSTRPSYIFGSGSSHTLHQVIEENKLMFLKQHTSSFGGADAGSNANKCMERSAPYPAEYALFNHSVAVDAHTTGGADAGFSLCKCMENAAPHLGEYDQFKHSLVVDAPTTVEKTVGKVSTQKLNVKMLVDTMHNLSKLLLSHCLNGACELKDRDHDVLKNVINNLNTCAVKNAEQITPAQECLSPKPETSRVAEESFELQQNSSSEKPQLTKVGPERTKVSPNPLVQESTNLDFRSEKPQRKLSDPTSPRDKAEMTKEDKMTKDLKKILSENFHDDEGTESQTILYKNLWLEAEAALCSVSFRARYNQMKIEMEKYSHKQRDMEEESNPEVVPSLNENQSSDLDSSSRLLGLNSTLLKDITGVNFSADMNKPNALAPQGKDTQDLDSSIRNSTVSGTNTEVEDDEASVIARFRVLKARAEKCINHANNLEEPSDTEHKLPSKGGDNQNQVNFYQESPIPGKNNTDYEASVMARFHVLKSRAEDSSSVSSERELCDVTVSTKDVSEGKSFDVHVNPAEVHLISSYTSVDKSIPKDQYLLDFDYAQNFQHCVTSDDDNQLPTYYSDGLASDWEHVEERSL